VGGGPGRPGGAAAEAATTEGVVAALGAGAGPAGGSQQGAPLGVPDVEPVLQRQPGHLLEDRHPSGDPPEQRGPHRGVEGRAKSLLALQVARHPVADRAPQRSSGPGAVRAPTGSTRESARLRRVAATWVVTFSAGTSPTGPVATRGKPKIRSSARAVVPASRR
jgi:hypothetical protein